MARYNVHLFQKVIEEGWIEVEAASLEGALTKAIEQAPEHDLQWSFVETCDELPEAFAKEIKL